MERNISLINTIYRKCLLTLENSHFTFLDDQQRIHVVWSYYILCQITSGPLWNHGFSAIKFQFMVLVTFEVLTQVKFSWTLSSVSLFFSYFLLFLLYFQNWFYAMTLSKLKYRTDLFLFLFTFYSPKGPNFRLFYQLESPQ